MPILEVQNLSVAFRADRHILQTAVRDVSFSVDAGTILGIVGESGCGKSVTASAIMGLLPKKTSQITGGSIRLDGRELIGLSDRQLRSLRGTSLAMIFQDPITSLNPVYRVGDQLTEMLQAHSSLSKKEAWARGIELLTMVGVADPAKRMKDYPHQLSGGMTQRVMIAMALSVDPQVLIADEPTTALDVTIQAQVLELIRDLEQKKKTAVLLITHDMGVVAEMADMVMVMYAGEVVEYASVTELFRNPRHPYTQGLLQSLPRIDRDSELLYSIEGTVPGAGVELPGCRFAPRCPRAMACCHETKPSMVHLATADVRCLIYGSEPVGRGEDQGCE